MAHAVSDGVPRELTAAGASLWDGWQNPHEAFDGFPEPGKLPAYLEAFGHVLYHGWDTYEETFAVSLPNDLADRLDEARKQAARLEAPVLVEICGETVQVSPHGARGGIRWWLSNDSWIVKIRPGNRWSVSVRLSAATLAQEGLEAGRERMVAWLSRAFFIPTADREVLHPDQWQRVTEAHWCCDVQSQAMVACMVPEISRAVVMPSATKGLVIDGLEVDRYGALSDAELGRMVYDKLGDDGLGKAVRGALDLFGTLNSWFRGGRVETLTIGFRRPLEIQIYDKGLEITEASGKTWLYDLWERSGWTRPSDGERPNGCYRTEIRMRSEWLKGRGVHTYADLVRSRVQLVAEALSSRRLTVPDEGDSNRSRWPAHPLWQMVAWVSGHCSELTPLGRRIVEAGAAIYRGLLQSAVGCLRSATVLKVGCWDYESFISLFHDPDPHAGLCNTPLMATFLLEDERKHSDKVAACEERYRFISCPV